MTRPKRTAATVVNGKIDSDKAKTAASKKTAVKTAAKKATTTKATVVKKPTAPKTTNTTAPKKAAPLKKASAAVKAPVEKVVENANTKRKRESVPNEEPASKKAKTTAAKPVAQKAAPTKEIATEKTAAPKKTASQASAPKKLAMPKVIPAKSALPVINSPPTQKLDVYVFGEGSAGELGLGSVRHNGKKPIDVQRPRLNHNLSAADVGVVQVAVGGMHCAALTHDNKILTWGVNDQSALGRDTTWSGGLKEANEEDDSDSDDDDNDTGMNPLESTPTAVEAKYFPEGTVFARLVVSDSATFALTTEGLVYGWGTFRGNDGVLGFIHGGAKVQQYPTLIPELKQIKTMAAGSNHVLAVNTKGKVFAWGAGEQNQLARRVVSRTATGALVPREFGLQRKSITHVACGSYNSFAVDNKGDVYAWGLNTFGQTGLPKPIVKATGEEEDIILAPKLVTCLKEYDIKEMQGGAHHTVACTKSGQLLFWGRIDTHQSGMSVDDMPKESLYFDEQDRPRYLQRPAIIPDINAVAVATAADTCIAVDKDGKAYSWGFSGTYQTGLGTTDDVDEATLIDNTAVRGKKLVFAGVGGQFGVLGGAAEDVPANGI